MPVILALIHFLLGYFNGTPAAAAIWGIDVIAPMHFGNKTIDLVVSGPNEGQNNGPFSFTISGTIGASYASVERGACIHTHMHLMR